MKLNLIHFVRGIRCNDVKRLTERSHSEILAGVNAIGRTVDTFQKSRQLEKTSSVFDEIFIDDLAGC